jgi:hypothetical protein
MEKLVLDFKIDYALDWLCGVSIKQLRDDLDAIEKLGATHVDIESNVYYDCVNTEINAISTRVETVEECNERIEKERRFNASRELLELNELKRLQEKYKL